MSRYDAILLDLDETLLSFHGAQRLGLGDVLAHHGLAFDEAALSDYRRVETPLWEALDRGQMALLDVMQGRFRLFLGERGIATDGAAENRLFLDGLKRSHELLDGALETCQALASRYPLGLVTNGDGTTQRARLAGSKLAPCFRALAISNELGIAKPDPRIFHHALRELAVPATARVLMVGDNLRADVGGALAAGLDACWVAPASAAPRDGIVPTLRVASVSELLKVL
jgi:YjjG family noncanonical pyrimidine nucleotidase